MTLICTTGECYAILRNALYLRASLLYHVIGNANSVLCLETESGRLKRHLRSQVGKSCLVGSILWYFNLPLQSP